VSKSSDRSPVRSLAKGWDRKGRDDDEGRDKGDFPNASSGNEDGDRGVRRETSVLNYKAMLRKRIIIIAPAAANL